MQVRPLEEEVRARAGHAVLRVLCCAGLDMLLGMAKQAAGSAVADMASHVTGCLGAAGQAVCVLLKPPHSPCLAAPPSLASQRQVQEGEGCVSHHSVVTHHPAKYGLSRCTLPRYSPSWLAHLSHMRGPPSRRPALPTSTPLVKPPPVVSFSAPDALIPSSLPACFCSHPVPNRHCPDRFALTSDPHHFLSRQPLQPALPVRCCTAPPLLPPAPTLPLYHCYLPRYTPYALGTLPPCP